MSVLLIERRILEDKQDVLLNPCLQMPDRENDALGFAVASRTPLLLKAFLQRLFLFIERQLRQQQRMANADLFTVELLYDNLGQLSQLQARGDVSGRLTDLGGNLLDAVFRFFQVEQCFKAPRLLQRMHVAALEVFDELRFQYLRVGHLADFDWDNFFPRDLRGTETLRSEDDFIALVFGSHKQGCENSLRVDAAGKLFQKRLIEDAARVGGR